MGQVVLLIGGNMGDRKALLGEAIKKLSHKFSLVQCSAVYETAAWGGKSSTSYLNQAVELETSMKPLEVLDVIQEIENELGRERQTKWGDRTMDIDIIYFGKEIIHHDRLSIPHPLMQERRFVLVPLVEILPDFRHPVFGKTNLELLMGCTDESSVYRSEY